MAAVVEKVVVAVVEEGAVGVVEEAAAPAGLEHALAYLAVDIASAAAKKAAVVVGSAVDTAFAAVEKAVDSCFEILGTWTALMRLQTDLSVIQEDGPHRLADASPLDDTVVVHTVGCDLLGSGFVEIVVSAADGVGAAAAGVSPARVTARPAWTLLMNSMRNSVDVADSKDLCQTTNWFSEEAHYFAREACSGHQVGV